MIKGVSSKKRLGRFIKKGDPLQGVVAIHNFALEEICENPTSIPDNARGNIIHSMLHPQEELNLTVRDPFEMKKDLDEIKQPILTPVDFTEDWRRQKARLARKGKLDEDEELELELEYIKKLKQKESEDEDDEPLEPSVEAKTIEQAAPAHATEQPAASHFKINKTQEAASPPPVAKKPANELENAMDEANTSTQPQPEFTPLQTNDSDGQNAEVNTLKKAKEAQAQEEEARRIFDEAEKEGYEKGIEQGRAEATAKFKEIIDNFGNMIHELESFKQGILKDSQENFHALCQAMMEALLKKEFSINPDSFAKVISRAIEETVTNEKFTIKVNSKTFNDLIVPMQHSMKDKFVVDDSLADNDFKIHSASQSIDGKLSRIVSDLLDQADLSLFDDSSEKAS
jgi:flagellar biosynthesis/type III secretory pathway protein FliH